MAGMVHCGRLRSGSMRGMVHADHGSGGCRCELDSACAARRCTAEIDTKRRHSWRIGNRGLGIGASRKRQRQQGREKESVKRTHTHLKLLAAGLGLRMD
jgi:hypothetical protein